MADWYGSARSNCFEVKDADKFTEFCNKWNIKPFQEGKKYGFLCTYDDKGGLPFYASDENNDEEYGFDDFIDDLSKQLKPTHVAILVECGAEKLRCITGFALAVNANGTRKSISIEEIYKRAKPLGKNIEVI